LANEGDDKKSLLRRENVLNEVNTLKVKLDDLNKLWQEERLELNKAKRLHEELEQAKRDLTQATQRGDFNKAGELMHGTIPRLERELEMFEKGEVGEISPESSTKQDRKMKKEMKMLSDAVTAEAIATIIGRHTGIPVSRITGSESKKLLNMESKLRERVVGQDHALVSVSNCVRLARTRLQARNRTLGNFLFLGPTGKLSHH